MKVLLYILAGLLVLVVVVLAGLAVAPGQYEAPASGSGAAGAIELVPIPSGLPAPVDRWLRAEYPEGLPAADRIVLRGTGVMRFGPVSVPMRHIVEIEPGKGFARRMDLTWYGITVARGRDTYVNGRGRMVTPVGSFTGEKIDQGANVVNWLEALPLPGVLARTPGVRWEPIDDHSARLVYPFGDGEDEAIVRFDPDSGEPVEVLAMRYKDADEAARKIGWTAGMRDRKEMGGLRVAGEVDATWEGADKPWATFRYTDVWVGVPLQTYEAAKNAR